MPSDAATFAEVLDACGDRMLVNVEIKNWHEDTHFDPSMELVGPILAELQRRGPRRHDRWLISSFSFRTIDACRVRRARDPHGLAVPRR